MATALPARQQAPVGSATTFRPAAKPQDKPDYDSLYTDPRKEAEYRFKKKQDFFHKTGAEFEAVLAAKFNDKTLKQIIKEEFDFTPDCMDDVHGAALIFAAEGQLELFEWLVEVGVDLGFVNNKGVSTLDAIAQDGRDGIIGYLIGGKKVNFNRISKYMPQSTDDEPIPTERVGGLPIVSAALHAQESTIKLLVSQEIWLSGIDKDGDTALHALLLAKNEDMSATEELQYRENVVRIAHNLLQLYGEDVPPNKPHQRLSYGPNHKGITVLGAALVVLDNMHRLLKTKLNVSGDELYAKLKPFTQLCSEIRKLSGESYGMMASGSSHARINILRYTRWTDDVHAAMLDLYKADKGFAIALYHDCKAVVDSGGQSLDDLSAIVRHISDIDMRSAAASMTP